MRYALITNGQVETVVEQDDFPTIAGMWVECPLSVGPGFLYVDGAFMAAAQAQNRHITHLAFITRFTDAEAIAIDLASIGATVEAAAVRRYLAKVNAAKFIDLDFADTRTGVQALETSGLIGPGRAAEILDAEVLPSEMP